MTYAADGQRRRGRPPRISRDHIVDAACEVGIENLTMAAVAERLGVTHQSLYGWVQDRDELIDLVSDRLIARIEIQPPADPASWRVSLRSYANSVRRLAEETPGFAAAGLRRFRTLDNSEKLNHDVLLLLTDVGFEPPMAQRVYDSLNSVLLGWLAREQSLIAIRQRLSAGPSGSRGLITDFAEAELRAPADERFEFLIHSFLAGLPDPSPTPVAPAVGIVVDIRDDLVEQAIGVE
ncbi:MAG: TetR/AcrR family transcriptional regulator [Ilumatobacter sp.]|uniref:TetR/AcrR family transcriptional regulator n=1 Tax=Ilumatobacter sp. TaxID=1967498 RepID=UPI00391B55AB